MPTATTHKSKRVFNLLKPYQPPLTGWDKIYDWLIGKARVIMIVAEIIVAVTFVTKVIVDTQAAALEDEIERKDAELQEFEVSTEPALRTMQNKVKSYKDLWNTAPAYSSVLAEADSFLINQGADFMISFNEGTFSVAGEDSDTNLGQIELQFKSSASFNEVKIPDFTADVDSGINSEALITGKVANLHSRSQLE